MENFNLFIYTYNMRLLLAILFLISFPAGVWAQERSVAVNENAFLIQKEISVWPTNQTFNSRAAVYNCQAVRLHPNWFLTSAHCVYSACATQPCTVEITLAESPDLLARVRVKHSTVSKNVYIYPGFFPGQNRISGMDVALIQFNPKEAEYLYVNLTDGKSLTLAEFTKKLRLDTEAQAQMNAAGARLLNVATVGTVRLKPQIVVPKMTAGVISYLLGSSREIYFVKELQHFISPGFGVRQGNSGGGVFTASGDLAGVVSSLLYAQDGSASFHDAEGKTLLTLRNANQLFFFTGFNGSTLNFIRNKVPGLRTVNVLPDFAVPSDKKFDAIVKAEQAVSMKF